MRTKARLDVAVFRAMYNASSPEFLLSIYCWQNLPRYLTAGRPMHIKKCVEMLCMFTPFFFAFVCLE